MIEYLVTTQKGVVVSSVPELPLHPEQLVELNRKAGGDQQWPFLYDLNLGFQHCEVTRVDAMLDLVTHKLYQQN